MLYYNKRNIKFHEKSEKYFHAISAPSINQLIRLDWTIKKLVEVDYYSELDGLWIFASEKQANGLINIINPSFTAATENGTTTWTPFEGTAGNGSNGFIDLGIAPSGCIKLTQDSASVFYYCRTNSVGAFVDMGASNAGLGNGILLISRFTGDSCSLRINGSGATTAVSNTNSSGLFHGKRTASNALEFFRNSTSLASDTDASTGLSVNNFYICGYNGAGTLTNPTTRQYSIAGLGSKNIDPVILSNILNGYMMLIGKNVY